MGPIKSLLYEGVERGWLLTKLEMQKLSGLSKVIQITNDVIVLVLEFQFLGYEFRLSLPPVTKE